MQAYQLGQRFTTAGLPLNGGKAYFYLTTTTTLEDVFEDDGLTTPLANPVVANSAGFFPELVYLDPTKAYRLILKTSADVTIFDADPINEVQGATGVDTADIVDEAVTAAKLGPTAIEDKLGFTPQEDLTALTAHEINVLLKRVGTVEAYFGSTAPTGALLCNGGTIGSASSGASALASADASDLFALLWNWANADSAILDSAGSASSRGASASADFAANKRLTLPDLRGEFIRGLDLSRGVDSARAIGSAQSQQIGTHSHDVRHATSGGSANDTTTNGGIMTDSVTAGNVDWAVLNTGTGIGSENRPRNIALTYIVRY
jgi:hypothetical protein